MSTRVVRRIRQIVERRHRRRSGCGRSAGPSGVRHERLADGLRIGPPPSGARRPARGAGARPASGSRSRRTAPRAPCRRAASGSSRPRRSGHPGRDALERCGRPGTACVSCGPGITVTASSAGRRRARRRCAENLAPPDRPSTLPSTSAQAIPSRSSTAASDSTDSGSGCLPGVVESGLKRTIIGPPRRRTRPATGRAASRASCRRSPPSQRTARGDEPAIGVRARPPPGRSRSNVR